MTPMKKSVAETWRRRRESSKAAMNFFRRSNSFSLIVLEMSSQILMRRFSLYISLIPILTINHCRSHSYYWFRCFVFESLIVRRSLACQLKTYFIYFSFRFIDKREAGNNLSVYDYLERDSGKQLSPCSSISLGKSRIFLCWFV